MRIILVLLAFLSGVQCRSGAYKTSRESLRAQVAMLRGEQWRDRERLDALERRVLARGERDSPSPTSVVAEDGLLEVLEELSNEIVVLAEELRRRQDLEGVVEALKTRQELGDYAVRQLSLKVKSIQEEQRNLSLILNSIGRDEGEIESETVGKNLSEEWKEEGSGDLVEDSLFPAEVIKNENKPLGKGIQKENKTCIDIFRKEQLAQNKRIEESYSRKISNISKQIEMVQMQTERVQDRCMNSIRNATDDMRSSMALMENLQDDLTSLWKRVSKAEFNSAQSQAALDVLEHDWTEDRKHMGNLQNRWNATQKEISEQSNRLLGLEMLTTNLTLQRCRVDAETSKRHLKVENVELRLAQVNHKIEEWMKRSDNIRKLDENALRNYRDALASIARRTENVSRELSLLNHTQANLHFNMNKFVQQLPEDCSRQTSNGVILIQLPTLGPKEVYCDIDPDGGPWIVIQRRINGSENFFRNWADYRSGFGKLISEFWLGNEVLHPLTDGRRLRLHIDMWDVLGRYLYAEYESFNVKSEFDQYALEIAAHSGNASDALSHHFGMSFSTFDRDNDASSANCAVHHTGGWWYQHCHRADLNGRYSLGMTWYDEFSHEWLQLQRVEMKVAPVRRS